MTKQLKTKIQHHHQGKYNHLVGTHVILSNKYRTHSNRNWKGNADKYGRAWGNAWKVECECQIIAVHELKDGMILEGVVLQISSSFKPTRKYEEGDRECGPEIEKGSVVNFTMNQCLFSNPSEICARL
tara:strand:+ start:6401 stop:6784 length:384 start_codon:yes stop_codon:yes gene_type:complete